MSPKESKELTRPLPRLETLDSISKINPLLKQTWGGIVINTLNTALLLAHARSLFNQQHAKVRGRHHTEDGEVSFVQWINDYHPEIGSPKAIDLRKT